MTQVSAYRAAPYQGVSQAPPQVRLPEQASAIVNSSINIPQGWEPRPPFEYVGTLANHPGATDGIFAHVVTTDQEAFCTVTKESGVAVVRVYDFDDLSQQTVTAQAAASAYLGASLAHPQADLTTTGVVDFTFIVNRRKVTANAATANATRNPEAIIWVRQAAYGRTYTVVVTPAGGSPTTVTLKAPTGATAASADWTDTDKIAASLISGTYTATDGATISGNLAGLSGFTVTRHGSVISLIRASGDFTVSVADGQGGTAMVGVKGKVQTVADLPKIAPDGFTVRLTQYSGSDLDDYFLRFEQTAGDGTGVWQETLAPGAILGLNPETMPVGLIYDAGWKLNVLAWKTRTTGDETLVPDPDFIGQPIEDLTFWRGRLALVAGEGVILSASDDPFRLYPRTLAAVLDSDPISRVNPSEGTTKFLYAVPFESRLVLFGEKLQCEVTAPGVLKPSTCDIDEMTAHPFSPSLKPRKAHGRLYFVAPKGTTASALFELQVDLVTNVADGEDLTAAIPSYLPNTFDRSALCSANFTGLYGTSGAPALYLHLFRYANGERVQNAFHQWTMPEGYALGGMFFRGNTTTLYLLACKDGLAHVLKCELAPEVFDPGSTRLLTRLDVRATETQCASATYNSTTDITTFAGVPGGGPNTVVTVRAPGASDLPEGLRAPGVAWNAGASTITIAGDWSTAPLFFGLPYEARWVLSTIYRVGQDNRIDRSGRLQLRRLLADYVATGYLRAEIMVRGRQAHLVSFEGLVLNAPDSAADQPPSASGVLSVGISGRNEETDISFVNDSHFGSRVPGFTWFAEFTPRSAHG